MKVWAVEYNWYGSYGAYEEKHYVVFARTKEKAIEKIQLRCCSGSSLSPEESIFATELDPMAGEVFLISNKSN